MDSVLIYVSRQQHLMFPHRDPNHLVVAAPLSVRLLAEGRSERDERPGEREITPDHTTETSNFWALGPRLILGERVVTLIEGPNKTHRRSWSAVFGHLELGNGVWHVAYVSGHRGVPHLVALPEFDPDAASPFRPGRPAPDLSWNERAWSSAHRSGTLC